MEKAKADNKLLKDLGGQITDLSELMGDSIGEAQKAVTEKMTPKQKINYKLFTDKLIKLKVDGKHKAAEDLKKAYSEQF